MDAAQALQAEIDRRMGLDEAAWAELRAGRVPASRRRGLRLVSTLGLLFTALGAMAGAVFGWNVHAWLERSLGWRLPAAMAAGALTGAVIALVAYRRRFAALVESITGALARGEVRAETVELKGGTLSQPGRFLLEASDGRRFQAPDTLAGLELTGRWRMFYVELDQLDERQRQALSLASSRVVFGLEPQ